MSPVPSVFQLQCSCNNYPWGKKGSESLAAKLCAKPPGVNFEIDNQKEYSEMWMGDYPELPSKVLETGEELKSVIEKNPEKLLGKKCIEEFGAQLPFLPKVPESAYL
jgi:mannose-6-phosphate isomerase